AYRLPTRKPRAYPSSTEARQPFHARHPNRRRPLADRPRRHPHPRRALSAEPYRALPYADPTGDIASARADKYTNNRPRKDGRTFEMVKARGIRQSEQTEA